MRKSTLVKGLKLDRIRVIGGDVIGVVLLGRQWKELRMIQGIQSQARKNLTCSFIALHRGRNVSFQVYR